MINTGIQEFDWRQVSF